MIINNFQRIGSTSNAQHMLVENLRTKYLTISMNKILHYKKTFHYLLELVTRKRFDPLTLGVAHKPMET